jgi:predicted Zn-dependent protease with MMP-like domain
MKRKFEYYINRALEELPEEFKEKMNNLVISVESYPSRTDLASVGIDDRHMLLGIFRGVPFGAVSSFYSGPVMPSEIVLFQRNIESVAETETELVEQIRITLLHEIGHYFGMSEEELEPYM